MRFLIIIFLFLSLQFKAQVNFVGNPSFESYFNCTATNYVSVAKYWNSLDSIKLGASGEYLNTCYPYVPYNAGGFQYPRTGNAYIRATSYCNLPTCAFPYLRNYPKNRLLSNLVSGKTYCAKMHVNLTNTSPYSIGALGIYLSDASVDTIKYCMIPLTYLVPQVQNPISNFIGDTLNWIEISGTFTATGIEKYLVIGNFQTDIATTKTITRVGGGNFSEYYFDDVSVIDFNLPAYAGPDKNINLGDSAFIGRPPEIGLECTWSSGTTTVGTGGGIWVKPPIGTYSYIVTQNICGNIKTDTVNVNVSPSSISETTLFSNSIGIYPQPAKDLLNININYFYESSVEVKVFDVNGRVVIREQLIVNRGKAELSTAEFSNGVYILQIVNSKGVVANKRLIIAR